MSKVLKKLFITILITGLFFSACLVLIGQEKTFMKYESELLRVENQIDEESLKNEQLLKTKNKISTNEYIEEVAREKLGLVMPNEIIFIDANS